MAERHNQCQRCEMAIPEAWAYCRSCAETMGNLARDEAVLVPWTMWSRAAAKAATSPERHRIAATQRRAAAQRAAAKAATAATGGKGRGAGRGRGVIRQHWLGRLEDPGRQGKRQGEGKGQGLGKGRRGWHGPLKGGNKGGGQKGHNDGDGEYRVEELQMAPYVPEPVSADDPELTTEEVLARAAARASAAGASSSLTGSPRKLTFSKQDFIAFDRFCDCLAQRKQAGLPTSECSVRVV